MKNLPFATIFKKWLPVAFLAGCLCGLAYIAAQQILRQSANDPQIQLAEDAAQALENGATPASVLPDHAPLVDMAKSLAPYVLVFDDAGAPLAGNATLNGHLPQPPSGVFDYIRSAGEDRITWQPAPGVRSAIVALRVNGANKGFVIAGRSLREVEKRESQLSLEVGTIFLLVLIGTFILTAIAALW